MNWWGGEGVVKAQKWNCKKCGHENRSTAVECAKCGHEPGVGFKPQSVVRQRCPTCGADKMYEGCFCQ